MLITTIEELRLHFSAHALDSIEPLAGILDNSEHDCLEDKLGTPLYNALCDHYAAIDTDSYVAAVASGTLTSPWDQLLKISQRIIAYDAFAHAIGMMQVSINNAGVNISTADDYGKPDKDNIETFRKSCYEQTAESINLLLTTLERWCKQSSSAATPSSADAPGASEIPAESEGGVPTPTPSEAIAHLWRTSRYYYHCATLLIPTATVLQQYLDFRENRYRFIQLLPDLHFIQDDLISDTFGSAFLTHLLSADAPGASEYEKEAFDRIRKVIARHLKARTQVLSYNKEVRAQAHDEAVMLTDRALTYLQQHQSSFDEQTVKTAPWYVAPPSSADAPGASENDCHCAHKFQNNRKGNKIFVTPGLY